MAGFTIVAKIILNMIGVVYGIKIILMAGEAIRWRTAVTGTVALYAIHRSMRPG